MVPTHNMKIVDCEFCERVRVVHIGYYYFSGACFTVESIKTEGAQSNLYALSY